MKYDITEFEKHPAARKMFETSSIVVYEDQHPVIQGHFQFLPKIDSLQAINIAFSEALKYGEQERNAGTIQGYHIGINMGTGTGQSVQYPHIHYIPVYKPEDEHLYAVGNRPKDPGFYGFLKNR